MAASSPASAHAESALLPMNEEARRARLEKLVDEHFTSIWGVLRRLGIPRDLADDAAQDVFLIASRRVDAIRSGSEYAFLVGTALRVARSLRRRVGREPATDEVDILLEERDASAPEERIDDQEACALAYRL